jgi:hypothetical protein
MLPAWTVFQHTIGWLCAIYAGKDHHHMPSPDFYTQDSDGSWHRSSEMHADTTSPTPYPASAPVAAPPLPVARALPQRRLLLLIGAGLVAVVVIITATMLALAHRTTPQGVAGTYCQSLTKQQYTSLYGMFTSALQQQISSPAFTASMRALDNQRGVVTQCSVGTVQNNRVALTLHRQKGGTDIETLAFDANDALQAAPDVAVPSLVATYNFCQSLENGDYTGAYHQISSGFQNYSGPPATFQSDAQASIQVTGAIKACHLQQVALNNGGHSATIGFGIDFARFTNMPAQVVAVTDSAGTWHVDQMHFTAAGISLPFPLPLSKVQNVINVLKTICNLTPPNNLCTIIQALP